MSKSREETLSEEIKALQNTIEKLRKDLLFSQRTKAEWLHTAVRDENGPDPFRYYCSNCGTPAKSNNHLFCSHCGAEMWQSEIDKTIYLLRHMQVDFQGVHFSIGSGYDRAIDRAISALKKEKQAITEKQEQEIKEYQKREASEN